MAFCPPSTLGIPGDGELCLLYHDTQQQIANIQKSCYRDEAFDRWVLVIIENEFVSKVWINVTVNLHG